MEHQATYHGLHNWHDKLVDKLGWIVLANKFSYYSKVDDYISSIKRLKEYIEKKIKTSSRDNLIDLKSLQENVNILEKFADQYFLQKDESSSSSEEEDERNEKSEDEKSEDERSERSEDERSDKSEDERSEKSEDERSERSEDESKDEKKDEKMKKKVDKKKVEKKKVDKKIFSPSQKLAKKFKFRKSKMSKV